MIFFSYIQLIDEQTIVIQKQVSYESPKHVQSVEILSPMLEPLSPATPTTPEKKKKKKDKKKKDKERRRSISGTPPPASASNRDGKTHE